MSQVDQKRAFNKMKHQLEPYRSLIIKMNSFLTWERNYDPGVLVATVTILYLTLYALDFTVLTLFALTMWFGVLCDYLFPTVSRLLLSNEEWQGEQEAQFEEVCSTICRIRGALGYWFETFFKESKSVVFVLTVSLVLLIIAYIGCAVNNLLLMYFLTLSVVLWPGIQKKKLLNALTEQASNTIMSKIFKNKNE